MLALPIHLCGDRGLFGNTRPAVRAANEPVHPRAAQIGAAGPTGGGK
jgi:hypothetical protein